MPVVKPSVLPDNRGQRDAQHHRERVHKQIVEHLNKNIGHEDIITGNGKVKIPIRGTKQYRFILDRGLKEGQGGDKGGAGTDQGDEMYEVWLDMEEVEEYLFNELALPRLKPKKEAGAETSEYKFDSYAIKGPQIDKKATLRKALARNAMQNKPGLEIEKDDLRYISYREHPKPKSNAVIFLALDVSGSMGEFHKRIARLFYFWIVRFLKTQYDNVEIKFIVHTTEAKEVDEHEFFNRVESGGTMVSSAYRLIQKMQKESYPTSDWNVYVLHASDGDNWQLDLEEVNKAIQDLCHIATLVGYLEIKQSLSVMWGASPTSTLSKHLKEYGPALGKEFVMVEVRHDKEIWEAIKTLFGKQAEEAIV